MVWRGLCSLVRWGYIYLDVIVVLARQLRGQLSFGLGTPIPQPADFRGELQAWRREGGGGSRLTGGRKRKEGKRKRKRRQSGQRQRQAAKHRELITSVESTGSVWRSGQGGEAV